MSPETGIESASLGLHAAVIPQSDLETGLRVHGVATHPGIAGVSDKTYRGR